MTYYDFFGFAIFREKLSIFLRSLHNIQISFQSTHIVIDPEEAAVNLPPEVIINKLEFLVTTNWIVFHSFTKWCLATSPSLILKRSWWFIPGYHQQFLVEFDRNAFIGYTFLNTYREITEKVAYKYDTKKSDERFVWIVWNY